MDFVDIKKYLDIAVRRIYWVIIPFLVVILAGFSYILKTPKVYQATTLILVTGQKVPENYVRSVVTSDIEDRLRTIQQQVTSRTNLESIIQEYNVYDLAPEKDLLTEEKVALFSKQISINVTSRSGSSGSSESAFSISFQGKNPNKVAQVTNALASKFISENLKIRESQAIGTSDFLSDEMESIKKQLMSKEEELKAYKQKYMGGLPEELQSNLSMLTGLRNQLEQLNSSLLAAEDRKLAIQQNIPFQREARSSTGAAVTSQADGADELTELKNQLITLQARYTDNHPNIIQLKKRIASLEQENQSKSANAPVTATDANESDGSIGTNREINSQLASVAQEISRLKAEIEETKAQIKGYEAKVEETPKREQELITINRDYDNLKTLYNSMLNRKLESDVSVNLEKKQKGEQFNVLDSAKVPQKPIKPNVQKLILMIFALALGTGCGLAYLIEMMDTSFRSTEDIEKDFSLPVLVSMPTIDTQIELMKNKRKKIYAVLSIVLGFFICAVGIVFATKGVGTTIDYLKNILDKI